jgi:predicted ATP-grasp superfamily ATP-dependent carboligase
MKTVLLTNGQQRKTLAVVRSLGKKKVNIIVAEETFFNPSGFSKYCKKSLVCPNAKKQPEKYYKWLYRTIIKYKVDLLFPMDDDVFEIVMNNKQQLLKICKITLPSRKSFLSAFDKGNSTKLAMKAGVPCPQTLYPEDDESLLVLTENMSYPLVVKPRISSGSRGIRIANDRNELIEIYKDIEKNYELPIIQEYIGRGQRFDVCLIFDERNQLKAHFIQKELRHFPIDIGPSTIQMSIEHPELLEMSMKIMKNIPWVGVVELEFMVDLKDNTLKFMEINPRFWGSLQTAITSGVDFPWLLYKIGIGEELDIIDKYKTGIMCRWLLPGDVLHFITNKNRVKMQPSFLAGKKHNVYDDMIFLEDPLPILGFVLACFRYLFDIHMWKFIFRR